MMIGEVGEGFFFGLGGVGAGGSAGVFLTFFFFVPWWKERGKGGKGACCLWNLECGKST